jgi:methylenetetrahydrofolate reductase (NADPH)
MRIQSILVVNGTPELAQMVRRAAPQGTVVDEATGLPQALERVQQNRPSLIILNKIEPESAQRELLNRIRQGWITRHLLLLVVETGPQDGFYRILDEVPAPEPAFTASGPLLPQAEFFSRLDESIRFNLEESENVLKASILKPDNFCLIWEQIPGPGAFEMRQEHVIRNARRAADGEKVCAISVTDNPGGNPGISTDVLSREIRNLGVEPLVHVAFRDRSRNQCESLLYQLASIDINSLLLVTGDYPSNAAFGGTSRPVFDLDSVNGLRLAAEMNRGMEHETSRRKVRLAPTDFFCGVAFTPFKREEAEVMGQYYKLHKKILAGADFVTTQVGYDARKLHELLQWLKNQERSIPAIASVYVLSYTTAKVMNANRIPGCVVTDKMVAKLAEEATAKDRGRQAQLDRAARMYAIAKGMGFAGASISGQDLPYESVEYVINKGEELGGRWPDLVNEFDYPQEGGFYLFKRDGKTGLNSPELAARTQPPSRPFIYSFSRFVHAVALEPGRPLFTTVKPVLKFVDKHKALKNIFSWFEYVTKTSLYGCQNCGDCALFDVAYLCPVSQCPKNQRNGPCGGSYNGWCEVYPNERKCIWVKAYRRLKSQHQEDSIGDNIIPPCDWALWESSSWLNFFMGRDHVSARLGIKPAQDQSDASPEEKPRPSAKK